MCMYDYFDDAPAFYARTERCARKSHKCDECGRLIAKGERYQHVAAKWEGELGTIKTCAHCAVIQSWLQQECGGFLHHSVVDDAAEHITENGIPAYGFGLARLVVMARNGWHRAGTLAPIPRMPASTHDAAREQASG